MVGSHNNIFYFAYHVRESIFESLKFSKLLILAQLRYLSYNKNLIILKHLYKIYRFLHFEIEILQNPYSCRQGVFECF